MHTCIQTDMQAYNNATKTITMLLFVLYDVHDKNIVILIFRAPLSTCVVLLSQKYLLQLWRILIK